MQPNIEHKFNSPNEELEWLRNKYKEESAEAKKGEKMIENQELAAKVLYEHIQKDPQKALGDNYKLPPKEQESLVAKILKLTPESHDKKIEELLAIAEGRGVLNAVSIVRWFERPALGRRFAPSLNPVLHPRRYFQTENKKPLSQVLNMVLYEISLPHEKEEEKRKKIPRIHLRHGAVLQRNDDFKSK